MEVSEHAFYPSPSKKTSIQDWGFGYEYLTCYVVLDRNYINMGHKKKLLTFPYSLVEVVLVVGPGSLPDLRTGIKATPRFMATSGPNKNPLASRPAEQDINMM